MKYAALSLFGQIFAKKSQINKSISYYKKANDLLVELQQNLTITLRPEFLIDKKNINQELMKLLLDENKISYAFDELEKLKNMTIMGYLMNRRRLFWSEKDPESLELLNRLNFLRKEYFGLTNYKHPELLPDEFEKMNSKLLEQKLMVYEKEIRQLIEKLYLINAKNTEYNQVKLLKWQRIRKKIPDNICLLEFYIVENQVWLFIVTKNDIKLNLLNTSLNEINKLLDNLYRNINFAQHEEIDSDYCHNLTRLYKKASKKLYSALLESVLSEFQLDQKLWLVPFGLLHYVPFNTLYTGKNYLIEERTITILPAASFLTQSIEPREPGIRILAHSNDGKLPYVHEEAAIAAKFFESASYLDKEATQDKLTGAPCQILHIAAHGWHRPDQPNLSCILLEDGYLYADDLLQKELDYELVTLSACESGKTIVSAGEELLGLIRGVLYAGAQSLLVSYWRVHDKLTTQLMAEFYSCLKDGLSKNLSLQKAQLKLINSFSQLHPAYWGAFQLIGLSEPLSSKIPFE